MAKWLEGDVSVNGGYIHYYRTGGEQKPKIVFNHGATDNGLCWTPLVKDLEDEYDCIMVDARGHGKSGIGKGDYSSATRAKDLAAVIRDLQLDRPVVGGHSMGADSSIHLASAYPELCRCIFLEDPPVKHPGEKVADPIVLQAQTELWKQFAQDIQRLKSLPFILAKRIAKKMNPSFPQVEIVPWTQSKRQVSEDFIQAIIGGQVLDENISFDVLKHVAIPALLIVGDVENGAIVSLDAARKLEAENANLRFVQLAGASHNIRRDHYDDYLAALRGFFTEVYS